MDELARLTIRVDSAEATKAVTAQRALTTETNRLEDSLQELLTVSRASAAATAQMAATMRETAIAAAQDRAASRSAAETRKAATAARREEAAAARAAADADKAAARERKRAAEEVASAAERSRARILQALGGAGLAIGVAEIARASVNATRAILQMADGYQAAANRIRLFTGSAAEATAVQSRLVEVATATRAPLEDIVRIYSRISAVSGDLGASQSQVLTATKAIAQTFILSGASVQEAASSGTQLAQALGSGALQGDELRSIMENNLALAQAIAAGFGVSVGELKKMGAEGQLTSQGVFKALLSQSDEIASKLGGIGPTMDAGLQTFNTGLTTAIGRLDSILGITRAIGSVFDNIGQVLASPYFTQAIQALNIVRRGVSGDVVGGGQEAVRLISDPDGSRQAARASAAQQALSNPLFRGAVSPLGMFPTGMNLSGVMQASAFDQRRALGLPVMEFGSGVAADPNGLAKLYEQAEKAGKDATDATERMLEAIERRDIEDQAARRESEQAFRRLADDIISDARTPRRRAPGLMDGITVAAPDFDEIEALERNADVLTRAARQSQATTQALADGLQRSIAQGIAGGFTDGTRSLQAFADNLKRTLINALSEGLANRFVGSLMGGSGGGGLLGGLGGLLGGGGAGAGKTAGIAKGGAAFGGLGLAGLGVGLLAGSTILDLFKPDRNQGFGTFAPGASITPQAEVMRAGTYNAPSGFNAGAYRFEAGRPSGTNVTGNVIQFMLPEGTPREMAQAMLVEFERIARAQGLPAGTLPLSDGV